MNLFFCHRECAYPCATSNPTLWPQSAYVLYTLHTCMSCGRKDNLRALHTQQLCCARVFFYVLYQMLSPFSHIHFACNSRSRRTQIHMCVAARRRQRRGLYNQHYYTVIFISLIFFHAACIQCAMRSEYFNIHTYICSFSKYIICVCIIFKQHTSDGKGLCR